MSTTKPEDLAAQQRAKLLNGLCCEAPYVLSGSRDINL
jgi:hypothetical protein